MAETLTQIAPAYDPLIDLVVSNGIIDQPQADELREEHARTGKPIRKLLIDMGYVNEDDLLGMMAAYQGCEVIDLGVMSLDTDVIQSIPANVARISGPLFVVRIKPAVAIGHHDDQRQRSGIHFEPRPPEPHRAVIGEPVQQVQSRKRRLSGFWKKDLRRG